MNKNLLLSAVVIFIIFSGVFLNSRMLNVDLMEARNFVTAREMVQHDNWLIPTMNGELRIAKPPLPTWITAGFMSAAGTDTNLLMNRIPAGISALVLLFFLYSFTKSFTGCPTTALFSVLVLSTSYMFMYMARKGTWDIYCHSFMTGGLWMLYEGLKSGKFRFFGFAGILMGLSWMSKGPVSFYTLLIPFLISYMVVYKSSDFRKNYKGLAFSAVLTLIICSAWPVYLMSHAPAEAHAVAGEEATAWFSRHIQPFWYYLQFPIMSGIWMFALIPLMGYRYFREKAAQQDKYRFLVLWIWIMLLLLSIIPEKKDRYLLPETIPAAILTAVYLKYLAESIKTGMKDSICSLLYGFYYYLSTAAAVIAAAAMTYFFYRYNLSIYLSVLFLINAYALYLLIRSRKASDGYAFVVSCAFIFAVCTAGFAPLASKLSKPKDFIGLMELRNFEDFQKGKVYSTDDSMKTVWAVGRQMIIEKDAGRIAEEQPYYLLTTKRLHSMEKMQMKEIKTISDGEKPLWHLYLITKN